MIRETLLLASLLMLVGCASSPAVSTGASQAGAFPVTLQDVPSDGLPPQKLEPGECGLFLWSQSAPRRFVFFTEATSGTAQLFHEGDVIRLQMTDSHGDIFGQFQTDSAYITIGANPLFVDVALIPGDLLEGGQRVASGRILIRAGDGWETVLPVTGARACMPG